MKNSITIITTIFASIICTLIIINQGMSDAQVIKILIVLIGLLIILEIICFIINEYLI